MSYVELSIMLLFWQTNFRCRPRLMIGRSLVRVDVMLLRRSHSNSQSMAIARKSFAKFEIFVIIFAFSSSTTVNNG